MGKVEFGDKLSKEITEERKEEASSEETWIRIKYSTVKKAEDEIGSYEGSRAKKPWVTEEMLKKMEESTKIKEVSEKEKCIES